VQSGRALLAAEEMYKGRIRQIEIKRNMFRAWNKVVSEPDELLVELLSETVEKLSGFKPDEKDIKEFLNKHLDRFIINDDTTSHSQQLFYAHKLYVQSPSKPAKKDFTEETSSPKIRKKRTYPRLFPPDGTLCKFEYKGLVYNGVIKNRQLYVNGFGSFHSFSTASTKITNTSRNGWKDWALKLPDHDEWILADTWRKMQDKKTSSHY